MIATCESFTRGGAWCVYAYWEWEYLRVLRAWGRLGMIRLLPSGSCHLYGGTLAPPRTVIPASRVMDTAVAGGHLRALLRSLGRRRCSCLCVLRRSRGKYSLLPRKNVSSWGHCCQHVGQRPLWRPAVCAAGRELQCVGGGSVCVAQEGAALRGGRDGPSGFCVRLQEGRPGGRTVRRH